MILAAPGYGGVRVLARPPRRFLLYGCRRILRYRILRSGFPATTTHPHLHLYRGTQTKTQQPRAQTRNDNMYIRRGVTPDKRKRGDPVNQSPEVVSYESEGRPATWATGQMSDKSRPKKSYPTIGLLFLRSLVSQPIWSRFVNIVHCSARFHPLQWRSKTKNLKTGRRLWQICSLLYQNRSHCSHQSQTR